MAPPRRKRPSDRVSSANDAMGPLRHIDHIVVLMLENRSFDHFLGYLSLPEHHGGRGRSDVDGLRPGWFNSIGDAGTSSFQKFSINHLGTPYPGEGPTDLPLTVSPVDPGHSKPETLAQMGELPEDLDAYDPDDHSTFPTTMRGFAKSFHEMFPSYPTRLSMGYYDARELPVFDYLAENYCVCDRWFSSYPGETWVNRLFATAGQACGQTRNSKPHALPYSFSIADVPTFFRTLDEAPAIAWKYYTQDFASIRLLDRQYVTARKPHFERISDFFDHAAAGALTPVSWIDPNFNDFAGNLQEVEEFLWKEGSDAYPYFPFEANDDHPPTDIRNGQQLVLEIYAALIASPCWDRSLFVITYDEHGGFFDHVPPPETIEQPGDAVEQPDDGEGKPPPRLGVRVPALVISPWVGRGSVGKEQYDHTAIIKTILQRFRPTASGEPATFTDRVDASLHLGSLLTEPAPRADTKCIATRAFMTGLLREHLRAGLDATRTVREAARSRRKPTDLQEDLAAFRAKAIAKGLPDPREDLLPARPTRPTRPRVTGKQRKS